MKNNSIVKNDHPASELAKAIIKSHRLLDYSAQEWFEMILDDCLAGFGVRLEKAWEPEVEKHLFKLGGLYADAVINAPFSDLLGGVYQELSSQFNRKGMGQYFTPESVATLKAKMVFSSDDFEKKPVVTFCEPTVGSGVLALAFMAVTHEENPHYLEKLSMTMIDLDRMCVKMATLQVMANNLVHSRKLGEIRAYHGNSLGDPKNLSLFYHASTPEFDAASEKEDATTPAKPKTPLRSDITGQLDLFDP